MSASAAVQVSESLVTVVVSSRITLQGIYSARGSSMRRIDSVEKSLVSHGGCSPPAGGALDLRAAAVEVLAQIVRWLSGPECRRRSAARRGDYESCCNTDSELWVIMKFAARI